MNTTAFQSHHSAFALLGLLKRLHHHMIRTSEVMVKYYYNRPWDAERVSPHKA